MSKTLPFDCNFIFARLCDNDFSAALKAGLTHVVEKAEVPLTEGELKQFLTNYLVFGDSVRRIHPMFLKDFSYYESLFRYFEKNLTITFKNKFPHVDHDGGSAVYSVHTKDCINV